MKDNADSTELPYLRKLGFSRWKPV